MEIKSWPVSPTFAYQFEQWEKEVKPNIHFIIPSGIWIYIFYTSNKGNRNG